jgi:trimeric autotransporter adhesin
MKNRALVAVFLCLGVSTLLAGCGGSSNGSSGSGGSGGSGGTTTPTPTVTSISPTSVTAGSGTLTLTVNGTNFQSSTTVEVGGADDATTYVSATQVTATVEPAQIASGGTFSVIALNGTTTSGSGTPVNLTVNNPAPTIASLEPSIELAGVVSPVVAVVGTGFVPTTVIQVGGSARTTTYISATQVNVTLNASDVAAAGSLSLTAVNASPGGGTSTATALAVNNPVPTVSTVSPRTVLTGANPTIVTITGTNFVGASSVLLNGAAVATTFVSPTQLTFSMASQATAAIDTLAVSNPTPGGGIVAAGDLFALVPTSAPTITSVSPTQFTAGSAATFLYVYGTNFLQEVGTGNYVGTGTVQWNGSPLTTVGTVGGTQELIAQVPANLLTTTGTVTITVTSTTSTQASNAVTISITNPPPPTLTSISPSAGPINTAATVTLNGTGFTASSTVAINGTNIAATFVSSNELTAAIPASSVTLPGNLNFTVTTPAPGGGTTAPLAFTAYVAIPNNSMVYNPANGLFYVSVPSSAGAPYGNSVVSVDPETGALGTPIPVGSEPDQLAISSDGTILWVGLDGASAIRQVDLTTGTAGLQFSLGGNGGVYANPPKALALAALPGSPNSVVVSWPNDYEGTVAIFDSGVQRGTAPSSSVAGGAYALLANGAKSEIYAAGGSYQTYTYNASGLTPLATGPSGFDYATATNDQIQIADGLLYTDFGQAFDAESGDLLGTFYSSGTTVAEGPTVADTTLGLAFILDNSLGEAYESDNQVQTFNLSNYTSTGNAIPIGVPASTGLSGSSNLTRWGTNGLAFRNSLGVFSLRSNLVKDLSTTDADLSVTMTASGGTSTGTSTTYTATVTDNGPSPSTNVALVVAPPATGVLVSATPSAGTCSIGSVISCDLGGLASGASATVVFIVNQTSAGTATMTVQASGSENDPNLSNNSASASVTTTGSTYSLTPALSAISPAAIQSGSGDTTITLTGAGFDSASSVLLGGIALPTTYSSSTELTATVPKAALATLGWAPVTVSNPGPGGGTSNPLPLSVFSVITLGVNHILYDPYSQKIMASVGSGSSTVTGNSIVAIDPSTATVGTPVPIGSQPENLALTSDGQILYTILSGSTSIGVFNMLTQSAEFTYAVQPSTGTDTSPLPRGIATQPGSESTVAIDLGSWAGNAIYSFNLTNQTAAMVGEASGPYSGSCISFLDAGDMLAFDTDTSGATLDHYTVTPAGFTYYDYSQYTESTLNDFGCFKLSGGVAFANAGGVANPATVPATQMGVFPVSAAGGEFSTSESFVPDASLQSAFYLVNTETNGTTYSVGAPDGIESFNQNTFMPIGEVSLNMETIEGNTSYSGVDVVRWGQDGLAVLTSGGHLYFMRGAFVVPGELSTNSAATLTSSSASSLTHGAGNTVLTLTGTNFLPGVAVTWNGSYRTTTIVSPTQVTVDIPASDLAAAGSGSLVATNPGATASSALTITIN